VAILGKGYIWPDAAGAPIALTAVYVPGLAFQVMNENQIMCKATLPAGGVPDQALLVRVDISFDGGTTWENGWDELSVPAYTVGDHGFAVDVPRHCTARISLRDVLADPDTTCSVYAYARTWDFEVQNRYELIELEQVHRHGVLIWDDGAGVADAVGAAFAYGPAGGTRWVPVGRANVGEIWAVTTGGPPTSLLMRMEESFDEGATFAAPPHINSVITGVANIMPNQIEFQSATGTLANGTYTSPRFSVTPNSWIRFSAMRTGAAVNLIAMLRLSHETT
jgi:hypothetical protein